MASRRTRAAAVAAALLLLGCCVESSANVAEEEALAADDECRAGEAQCALNALQLRSQAKEARELARAAGAQSSSEAEAAEEEEGSEVLTLAAGPDGTVVVNGEKIDVRPEAQAMGADPNLLRKMCPEGPGYCVIGGYMIVPRRKCPGMECINGGNAVQFDQYMTAAYHYCSAPNCVLITNPVHHRTQNQLHIHYRRMNGGGVDLKHRLEGALCHRDGGWHSFHECGTGKARLFSSMPGAFSAVDAAYGGANMAHIGITVWPGSCGAGVIVLATTHCSIEHSISAR